MTEYKKVTEEMRKKLRAPLDPAAISQHPTKKFLSTIKSIYVTERLNDVFGVGSWSLTSVVIEKDGCMVVVKTQLCIEEYGISLEQFGGNDNGGENSKNFDLGDAYKGAVTDVISKIGSYLEIGIDVFKNKSAPKKVAYSNTPGDHQDVVQESDLRPCHKCQSPFKLIPGGTSKSTNKPYKAFYACTNKDCKNTMNMEVAMQWTKGKNEAPPLKEY